MAKVYFVAGLPGSGKSYYSKKLAKELNLEVVDFDDNLNEFVNAHHDQYQELGSEKFLANYASERYADLINRAVVKLKQNISVVVTAPFSKQIADLKLWEELIAPLKIFDAHPTLLWIVIPDQLRKKRLIIRGARRDQEKIKKIDKYMATAPVLPPAVPHIQIHGDGPFTADFKSND